MCTPTARSATPGVNAGEVCCTNLQVVVRGFDVHVDDLLAVAREAVAAK